MFELEVVDVIGICSCYILVTLLYLAAFYSAMLKRNITFRGKTPLVALRFVSASVCLCAVGLLSHFQPSPTTQKKHPLA